MNASLPSITAMADMRLTRLVAMLLRMTGADAGGLSIVYRDEIWRPSTRLRLA